MRGGEEDRVIAREDSMTRF